MSVSMASTVHASFDTLQSTLHREFVIHYTLEFSVGRGEISFTRCSIRLTCYLFSLRFVDKRMLPAEVFP